MFSIYIVTFLILIGSDILPSKVFAGSSDSNVSSKSSGSGDSSKSSDSNDNDEHYCKQAEPRKEAIENKIKYLNNKNLPLPTCTVRIIIFHLR